MAVDIGGRLLRGRARRDGRRVLPRPRLEGDVGTGDGAIGRIPRAGDSAREATEGAGDTDLIAGEAGRARRDIPAIDGLAGRGSPPAKRPTAGLVATCSGLSCELGPGIRRNRSSSWVLSLRDKVPTNDHIFSPIKAYASLY